MNGGMENLSKKMSGGRRLFGIRRDAESISPRFNFIMLLVVATILKFTLNVGKV